MTAGWGFLTVIEHDYGLGESEYRLFSTESKARRYVEGEHERRWDYEKDDMKPDESFEEAAVYRVAETGLCELVQRYTTVADKTGYGEGWIVPGQTEREFGD